MVVARVFSQIEDVIKYFNQSRCDDWVDRLSHVYTVLLLLVFATVVSTSHLVGDPIQCWIPAEYHKDGLPYDDYINNYCWIKNTYNLPMLEAIPTDITRRQDEEITYYQWVPLTLCLLALLFKLPHFFWKLLHTSSGLDLDNLSELVESGQDEVVSIIVDAITRWIKDRQQNKKYTLLVRTKTWRLLRHCCFFVSKQDGRYLTALYLVIKLLYLVNAVGQIVLLNAFITTDASMYALEWLRAFTSAPYFVESQRFPRVTLCDYQIRQMNNIHRYTVQCVLPINLFNEKLFLFLWFWFCLVALLNVYTMSNWLYLLLRKKNNYTFIKKYLKSGGRELNASNRQTCREFAEEYLRGDGCFVLRMLEMNSTGFVVQDVVNELFTNYQKST